jgi:hypothetical protein
MIIHYVWQVNIPLYYRISRRLILVNSNGVNSGAPRPFIETTEADWAEEINLNHWDI